MMPNSTTYETPATQYPWGFKPHFPLDSSTRFPDEPEYDDAVMIVF
jgi:hypothetical protein